MENASKALLMAAEILIAVLIMSLIVALTVILGNFSRNMNGRIEEDKTSAFNQHFLDVDQRIDITAQEIATLINFSKESNDSHELEFDNKSQSPYYVDVLIDGVSFFNDPNQKAEDNEKTYKDKNLFKQKLNNFIATHNTEYYSTNVRKTKYTPKTGKMNFADISVEEYVETTDANSDIKISKFNGQVTSINFNTTVVKKNGQTVIFNTTTRDYFTINGE